MALQNVLPRAPRPSRTLSPEAVGGLAVESDGSSDNDIGGRAGPGAELAPPIPRWPRAPPQQRAAGRVAAVHNKRRGRAPVRVPRPQYSGDEASTGGCGEAGDGTGYGDLWAGWQRPDEPEMLGRDRREPPEAAGSGGEAAAVTRSMGQRGQGCDEEGGAVEGSGTSWRDRWVGRHVSAGREPWMEPDVGRDIRVGFFLIVVFWAALMMRVEQADGAVGEGERA